MAGQGHHDGLIRDLVADLQPVRRLPPPDLRALCWLAVVAVAAAALATRSELAPVRERLAGAPDMWLAAIGSALTAVLAAVAAFRVGLPDRSPTWWLLPLPGATLWLGASGLGCLRAWSLPGLEPASLAQEKDCLLFIVGLSVPLSALLLTMLRRARPLRPEPATALGGLAAAAAAATLLVLFHPYDAGATDLLVHVIAVTTVIGVNRLLGGRILGGGIAPVPHTA